MKKGKRSHAVVASLERLVGSHAGTTLTEVRCHLLLCRLATDYLRDFTEFVSHGILARNDSPW